ncbi:hypothetical protein ALC62_12132 [Cyphomyrmex costatus]|uniref:Uncharacterized protein n=1 Tax=Cyphomyrmex costatus TaxID=456900 RepID=A0A151IC86_9HYME|nr:hypothetical protein ALC62_12132 [Cyphomyrmex costatus]
MSLSSSSAIRFLQRNTISSSCGGTVRDKKRASSVMLRYREEGAAADTNGKKKSTTAKQRSIDVDQYRDKKKRGDPLARLGATPLTILSTRGKFSPPRGSHHTAQMTGAAALPPRILVLVANTRGITRKVCAGGHCRSRLGKKRPKRTLRVSRRGRHVERIAICSADEKKQNDSCCRIEGKFKINFCKKKRNDVRGVLQPMNFHFTKRKFTNVKYQRSNGNPFELKEHFVIFFNCHVCKTIHFCG